MPTLHDAYAKASDPKLAEAILLHERWLDSRGQEGRRLRLADFAKGGKTAATIRGARLDKVDARGADLTGWTLDNVLMRKAEIDGLKAGEGTALNRVSLDGATGKHVDISGMHAHATSFRSVSIGGLSANGSRLNNCDLDGFQARNVEATGMVMKNVRGEFHLRDGSMRGLSLEGSRVSGSMRNIDLSGLDARDSTFRHDLDQVSLRDARLHRVDTAHASWTGVSGDKLLMTGCDACRMTIRGGSFKRMEAEQTNMRHTRIAGANLSAAKLAGIAGDDMQIDGCKLLHSDLGGVAGKLASFTGNDTFMTAAISVDMEARRRADQAPRLVKTPAPTRRAHDLDAR